MSSNTVIKSLPNAMGVFMVANGLLAPMFGLGADSIRAMALSIENEIGKIIEQSNILTLEFFPNGAPKFISNNEVGVIAYIFMHNQLIARGNEKEEIKNLNNAVIQSDLMLSAVKQLKIFQANTENVFEVMKYTELFNALSVIKISND